MDTLSPVVSQEKNEYLVISTDGTRGNEEKFKALQNETRHVHIHGYPFLWAIKLILEKCPNLEVIRMVPTMLPFIQKGEAQKLLDDRGIRIESGHHGKAWTKQVARHRSYATNRNFLLGLTDPQRNRLTELFSLQIEEGQILSRYFCLEGEPYKTQTEVGVEFGYQNCKASIVCALISAALHYIAPDKYPSQKGRTKTLALKIRKARRKKAALEDRQKFDEKVRSASIDPATLPANLSMKKLSIYCALMILYKKDGLAKLKSRSFDCWKAVVLRYGLADGKIKSFAQVAKLMGVHRSQVYALQGRAIYFLWGSMKTKGVAKKPD